MRAINVVLAILVSLLIGLAVLEGGLRLLGQGPQPSILEFDEHLGWRKKASSRIHKRGPDYSVTIETNRYHLRDDDTESTQKKPGSFRVLALGDSFTQGFTVDRRDLFVDLLEKRWQAEGRHVEIVNAGCEGYSTDQEVAWLGQHGASWQPDLVILFAYENDLYWNSQPRYLDRNTPKALYRADGTLEPGELQDPGPRPLADRLAITRLLKPLLGTPEYVQQHLFVPSGGQRPILKEFAPLLTTPPDFMADVLARTQGALIAFKESSARLGARALLIPIPSHSAVDGEYRQRFGPRTLGLADSAWSPDRPVDTFLFLSKEAGLETLDPRTFLREQAAKGEKLYFDVDWHLNPAGNRVFAQYLYGELERLDVFPPEFRAVTPVAASLVDSSGSRGGVPFWLELYAVLAVVLSAGYALTYKDEKKWLAALKVCALLAVVFAIAIGGNWLVRQLPTKWSQLVVLSFVLVILGFVLYKLGRRLATIFELFASFVARGHWYLMPLVVVLLSIGSLLVVAASSPFVAPFIYTLF